MKQKEIGLDRSIPQKLGVLPNHETITRFLVTPVMFKLPDKLYLKIDKNEVDEVFYVPFRHILNLENYRIQARKWKEEVRYYYVVPYGPYYIWVLLLGSYMALLKAIRMQINSEWIKNKVTQNILKIFEGADHNAYLVGGCIRNSILNIPVTDIDISTDATPQQTVDLFNRENFKVAPTGFSHGTVTVISEGISYQITTMRSDQNTDGRHADVVFSDDIKKDAEEEILQ